MNLSSRARSGPSSPSLAAPPAVLGSAGSTRWARGCRHQGWRVAAAIGFLLPLACQVDDNRVVELGAAPSTLANAAEAGAERAEGQHYFLSETWGAELRDEWPPVDFLLDELERDPERWGPQFSKFGFLPDPTDDLPIGFKRGTVDDERVYQTCALCHVGALDDGRLWLGQPNARLDFGAFRLAVNDAWVAAGHAPLVPDEAREKWPTLGPGRFDAASADYPNAVPADFPPYFRLGQKTALNYLGTGGDVRSEAAMALYTFGAGANADQPFPSPAKLDAFLAFLGHIEPPPPPPVDESEAALGAGVFARAGCAACHSVFDEAQNGVVPMARLADGRELEPREDPAFPRGTIGTSPAHRILIDGENGAFVDDTGDESEAAADPGDGAGGGGIDVGRAGLIAFIVTNGFSVGLSDGYRVPSLAGLAHTAPYLHNGSVPTLEALLAPPAERPVRWEQTCADGSVFVVDTEAFGLGNGGHAFGTDLDEDDKRRLIEFLRSL